MKYGVIADTAFTPSRPTALPSATVWCVEISPIWASTGTRPSAASTQVSATRSFSSDDSA